jgi:hypothetical protein
MRALLGYRGLVDHQHGVSAADKLIRLNQQFCLHTPGIQTPAAMKWNVESLFDVTPMK